MRRHEPGQLAEDVFFDLHADRALPVGVLPRPVCNPAVSDCGLRIFPHQRYHAGRADDVVEHVVREIDGRILPSSRPWPAAPGTDHR